MSETPREAALRAELDRVKAENIWLRRHVESAEATVTEYGMMTDMTLTQPMNVLTLPLRASISGKKEHGRWEVIATYDCHDGQTLRVSYFVSAETRKHRDDWSFINEVLPRMHRKFIDQLAELYAREHKA